MRTVVHDGQEYHLTDDQDWITYIATDADGRIHGFGKEPIYSPEDCLWDTKGSYVKLGKTKYQPPMTKL